MSKVSFYGAVTLTGAPSAVEKAKPLLEKSGASFFPTNETTVGLKNVKASDLPKLEKFVSSHGLKIARCSCLQEVENGKKPKKRNASRLNLQQDKWYYADAAEDRYPFLYVRNIKVDEGDNQIFEVELLTPENAVPTKSHLAADELAKFGLRPASSDDFTDFELPVPAKTYLTEAKVEAAGPATKALASWDLNTNEYGRMWSGRPDGKYKETKDDLNLKEAFAKSLVAAFKKTAGYWGESYQNSLHHLMGVDEFEHLDEDDVLRALGITTIPPSDDPELMLDVLKEVYTSAIYDAAPSPDYFLDAVKSTVESWINGKLEMLAEKIENPDDPWSLRERDLKQAVENLGDFAADQAFFGAIGGDPEWPDFDTYLNDIVDKLWHEGVDEKELLYKVEELLWPTIQDVAYSAGEEEWKSIQEDMTYARNQARGAVQEKIQEMAEESAEEEFIDTFHATKEELIDDINELAKDRSLSVEDIVKELALEWGADTKDEYQYDYLDPSHPIWNFVLQQVEITDPRQQQLKFEGKMKKRFTRRRKTALYYHHARTLMEGLMQEIELTALESEGQELEGSEGVAFARETYPEAVKPLTDAQLEVLLDTFYQDWQGYVGQAFEYLHDEIWAETEKYKNAWVKKWSEACKKYLASKTDLTPDQKEDAYELLMDEDDGILYAVWEEAGSGIGTWECEGVWEDLCDMDIKGEDILALMPSGFTLHEDLYHLGGQVAEQALIFAVKSFKEERDGREAKVRRKHKMRHRQAMPLRPHHYDNMVKQCLREYARKSQLVDHFDCVLDTLIDWNASWDEWEIMAEREGVSIPNDLRESGDLQSLRMHVINSLNYDIARPLNQGDSELVRFGGSYTFTLDDDERLIMLFFCPPDADCEGLLSAFGGRRRGSFNRRKKMAHYDLREDVAVFDDQVLSHLNYQDAYEGEADTMEYEVEEILPANASDEEFWAVVKKYDLRKKMGTEADEEDLQKYLYRYVVMPMNSGYSELPAGQYEITLDEDTGRLALVFFADEEDMYKLRNYLHGYDEDQN